MSKKSRYNNGCYNDNGLHNFKDFETINKVIRTYIKQVLKADEKINQFIPNTNIAET